NLQRIRELTVQAQNDTNSPDDLASIQTEIDQRLEEIDRIGNETKFNGKTLIDGAKTFKIQVGSEDTQQIEIDLTQSAKVDGLGLTGFSVGALSKLKAADFTDGTAFTFADDAT